MVICYGPICHVHTDVYGVSPFLCPPIFGCSNSLVSNTELVTTEPLKPIDCYGACQTYQKGAGTHKAYMIS